MGQVLALEKREAKFRRLASGRTMKVLQALEVLGRLSAADRHEWASGDVDAIFGAIQAKVKRVEASFRENGTPFRLP